MAGSDIGKIVFIRPAWRFAVFFLFSLKGLIENAMNGDGGMFLIHAMWLLFSAMMIFGLARKSRAFFGFVDFVPILFLLVVLLMLWSGRSGQPGLGGFHAGFIAFGGMYFFLYGRRAGCQGSGKSDAVRAFDGGSGQAAFETRQGKAIRAGGLHRCRHALSLSIR